MDEVSQFFIKNHGYARMHDLKSTGIHTREIASALRHGIIEKFAPGKYKLANFDWDEFAHFTDIANVRSDTVFRLESAAEYHGLTTFNFPIVTVAIPKGAQKFTLKHPPLSINFFSPNQYKIGILISKSINGESALYSMEKTVIDLFRFRNKTGMDFVLEVLKNYLNRKDRNINLLTAYAKQFQVYRVVMTFIQAIIA